MEKVKRVAVLLVGFGHKVAMEAIVVVVVDVGKHVLLHFLGGA